MFVWKKLSLQKLLGYLMWGVFFWLLSQRIPDWWNAYQLQGKSAQDIQVLGMNAQQSALFEQIKTPAVLIFWATWCGPCQVELDRYQSAINNKEIPQDRVYAISIGEELALVQKISQERGYTFPVFVDVSGASRNYYSVRVTPTVVILDQQKKVDWVGTGISPLGIQRAKRLFAN